MFREIIKYPRAKSQILEALVRMLNVEVGHITLGKRLNKYCFDKRGEEKEICHPKER